MNVFEEENKILDLILNSKSEEDALKVLQSFRLSLLSSFLEKFIPIMMIELHNQNIDDVDFKNKMMLIACKLPEFDLIEQLEACKD